MSVPIDEAWLILKEEEEVEEEVEEYVKKPCTWCPDGVVETAPSDTTTPMCNRCANSLNRFNRI